MKYLTTIRLRTALAAFLIVIFVSTTVTAQQWGGDDVTVEFDDDEEIAETTDQDEAEEGAGDSERAQPRERAVVREQQIREATRRQLDTSANSVHIYQLAEEMIDEIIADVSKLNVRALAPVAFRQMTLTPNLNEQFGEFVESTMVTAFATHTDIGITRCIACNAMRTRVEGDDWVITRGLVHQEDLKEEARRLGTKAFLDARFSYFPGANIVAMQVEMFRAEDGAILWSETYRSDATTAAILRTGDRVQSRSERVAELERKIDARPYYGHQLTGGFGYIPYDAPSGGLGGAMVGYRLYEKFGPDRRYLYAIGAEGFANFNEGSEIMGAFFYGVLQAEIYAPNLNRPIMRTGPAIGGFFAGDEGNSFVAEWTFDAVMQFRLGAGASIFYFLPTEFDGYDLGGFGMKGRISFNW